MNLTCATWRISLDRRIPMSLKRKRKKKTFHPNKHGENFSIAHKRNCDLEEFALKSKAILKDLQATVIPTQYSKPWKMEVEKTISGDLGSGYLLENRRGKHGKREVTYKRTKQGQMV